MAGRMVGSGGANVLGSVVVLLVPILGRHFLDARGYATWALVASVLTTSLILDFGGPAMALRDAARGSLTPGGLRRATFLSASGSLAIGALAAAAWLPYSAETDLAYGGLLGSAVMLCAGAAGAVRSALIVHTAILIPRRRYGVRSLIILTQGVLQLVLTWSCLRLHFGIWSLVIGAMLSSGLCFYYCVAKVVPELAVVASDTRTMSFAVARTVATLLGVSLTQLDRWVIAAVASPGVVGTFDITARFATLPRVGVLTIAGVLVADAAGADSGARRALLRRATSLVAVLLLLASALVVAGVLVLGLTRTPLVAGVSVPLLAAMLTWYGVNALTAPPTLIATGLGRPQEELLYLIPTFCVTTAIWCLSAASHSAALVVFGPGVNLAFWSVMFMLFRAGKVVRRDLADAQVGG